jgi:hypothetical protein
VVTHTPLQKHRQKYTFKESTTNGKKDGMLETNNDVTKLIITSENSKKYLK